MLKYIKLYCYNESVGSIDLIWCIFAIEESVLVFALLVDLAHEFLILLQFVIWEEYCECLLLLQRHPLSDDLEELLESEIKRDQEPKQN